MHKRFRDTGRINKGGDDLSELELSSDEEYDGLTGQAPSPRRLPDAPPRRTSLPAGCGL
jgi:hypothetical protein